MLRVCISYSVFRGLFVGGSSIPSRFALGACLVRWLMIHPAAYVALAEVSRLGVRHYSDHHLKEVCLKYCTVTIGRVRMGSIFFGLFPFFWDLGSTPESEFETAMHSQ